MIKISPMKIAAGVLGTFVLIILATQTWYKTSTGYNYVVQNTYTGSLQVFSDAGVHLKLPFFTNVYPYKQATTINFSGVTRDNVVLASKDVGKFTRQQPASNVAFADTYSGDIAASFRFRLPADEEHMIKLHKEFRSFDNMVDALLVRTAGDVLNVTATQYTGEEFFQGGVNHYKVQLADQLKDGLYVTRRKQVTIEDTEIAAVSPENSDSSKLQKVERKVWKNVVELDREGTPKRQKNPLEAFDITMSQVTLGKSLPSLELDTLLDDKRARIGKRIAAIEQLATAEAEAKAVQQQEEIETVRVTQVQQRAKDLAVIVLQQEVAVAREQAIKETVERNKLKELAVIDKQKELAVATADKDIQQAAAQAAKFQAEAILATGLAEAQVSAAMLQAKQDASAIYMAEIQRDIARVMYPALKDVTIDMPDFYSASGTDGVAPTSLDVYTTLGALTQIETRASSATAADVTSK